MHYIGCQKKLERIFHCTEEEAKKIGIDLSLDNEFLFSKGCFQLDCSWPLFQTFGEICLKGKEDTTLVLQNGKRMRSLFTPFQEVQIFDVNADVIFQNVVLTANELTEIRFFNREEALRWAASLVDRTQIQMIIMDELEKGYVESIDRYNVKGILEPGDHVVVDRILYTHHGIYIGHNMLIHYSGEGGTIGEVAEIPLDEFVKNDEFWVYKHENPFPREKIVQRAKSRLHENLYNMTFNNCEHFCHWCVTGYSWSNQIYVGSFLGPAGVIIGKVVNEGDYPRYTLSDL